MQQPPSICFLLAVGVPVGGVSAGSGKLGEWGQEARGPADHDSEAIESGGLCPVLAWTPPFQLGDRSQKACFEAPPASRVLGGSSCGVGLAWALSLFGEIETKAHPFFSATTPRPLTDLWGGTSRSSPPTWRERGLADTPGSQAELLAAPAMGALTFLLSFPPRAAFMVRR